MKILILGSSGWLAHYVLKELIPLGHEISGISHKHNPIFNIPNKNKAIEAADYLDTVNEFEGDIIINMLHSKNFPIALKVNNGIADLCKKRGIHYVYCSSSNALDGELDSIHSENTLACAASEYGIFKADGEKYLYQNFPQATILRFPAVHGFSPNSQKRTQTFLEKLQNNEVVTIDKGIIQNRPYAGHFAKMLITITLNKASGIYHIGTADYGEEIDFLRKLASTFGYDSNLIKEGKYAPHKMVVLPGKIFDLPEGEKLKFTQNDTIEALKNDSDLITYFK